MTTPQAAPVAPAPASPTSATTLHQHPERGRHDRATIDAILDAGLVCHVGVALDGQPLVMIATPALLLTKARADAAKSARQRQLVGGQFHRRSQLSVTADLRPCSERTGPRQDDALS